MFTIKFYSADGHRQIIKEAESFTILRDCGEAEITLHQKVGHEDRRYDIKDETEVPKVGYRPPRFGKAIIENASGRTTEIIVLGPSNGTTSQPLPPPLDPPPLDVYKRYTGADKLTLG